MMFQPQQTQQKKRSSLYTFLKSAWPVLSLILVGIIVYFFTDWIGKIHIVNFDWLVLGLVIVMGCIVAFFIGYSFKTRDMFQDQYEKDITALRQETENMKAEHLKIIQSERNLFDQWQQRVNEANEQKAKHYEKLIGEQQQAIENIKQELTVLQSRSSNLETGFTNHVQDHTREKQKIMSQMDDPGEKINPA